jgi:hypothetical protein
VVLSRPKSPGKGSGVSGPIKANSAGDYNSLYVLCRDLYGDVYAQYVGPYDGFIKWSISVPKTLVTNMRGPIAKWVPKSKN